MAINIFVIVIAVCSLPLLAGFRLNSRPKRAEELLIRYVKGQDAQVMTNQTVTIDGNQVEFDTQDGMRAVVDFKQMLLTMTRPGNVRVCMVTHFDANDVPISLEQIKNDLLRVSEFVMPTDRITLKLQRSKNQTQPELSPLSAMLCENRRIIILEPKTESPVRSFSLSRRPSIRPKREEALGELFVISSVIVVVM